MKKEASDGKKMSSDREEPSERRPQIPPFIPFRPLVDEPVITSAKGKTELSVTKDTEPMVRMDDRSVVDSFGS